MFSLPYMRVLTPLFALAAIVALFAYAHLTLREAEYAMSGPTVVSVTGEGEAVAVPDIAEFTFGVLAEGADAAEAQDKSAEAINAILGYLEDEGVEEGDIKTEYYNLNPKYEWIAETELSERNRVLVGYEVSQTVSVKVRDTDEAGELISGVGDRGATNVSSVQFTTEDDETLRAEARANAIADAREKAEVLADDLDVRIVRMTGFWEEQSYAYGLGGAERSFMAMDSMAVMEEKAVPNLPVGENKTTVRVNISYEVR
ncbi:SIMPL domain-containing protein [Candidatus Kaiserbacteria bacterium]|nr:SIMPL domain-containing protein [Candidatus Kaiserbacteria bacterium]